MPCGERGRCAGDMHEQTRQEQARDHVDRQRDDHPAAHKGRNYVFTRLSILKGGRRREHHRKLEQLVGDADNNSPHDGEDEIRSEDWPEPAMRYIPGIEESELPVLDGQSKARSKTGREEDIDQEQDKPQPERTKDRPDDAPRDFIL